MVDRVKAFGLIGVVLVVLVAAGCGGSGKIHFATTKFVLHAGLAFGAFHHFIYKPLQAGDFKHPLQHKATLVKAGLAAVFAAHELKIAYKDAKASKPLSKLAGSLDALATKIDGIGRQSQATATSTPATSQPSTTTSPASPNKAPSTSKTSQPHHSAAKRTHDTRKERHMLKGFKSFLMQGDLIVIAVGLVIALAFSTLIKAFADNVITPLVNAAGGGGTNGLGFTVKGQLVNIGAVISAIIYFIILVAVIYFVIVIPYRAYQKRRGITAFGEPAPTKTCPYCLSDDLPTAASKCKHCASTLDTTTTPA